MMGSYVKEMCVKSFCVLVGWECVTISIRLEEAANLNTAYYMHIDYIACLYLLLQLRSYSV